MMIIKKTAIFLMALVGLTAGSVDAQVPNDGSKITKDVIEAAEWIAQALNEDGYRADFSIESLSEVDRFFDDNAENGKAKEGGRLTEDRGSRIFALGSYVGETIRRNFGGKWEGDDNDTEAEINVQVLLPQGGTIWPIQRAMKRFANGREDSFVGYAAGLKDLNRTNEK